MVLETVEKEVPDQSLKIEYEPEVDILTIYLEDPDTPLSNTKEAANGVLLNHDNSGNIASIEILDASRRYPSNQLAAHSVDELIDLKTAANISGIAPVTLRTQAEKGRLWALKLAGQWVTTRERLQQYLDNRQRKRSGELSRNKTRDLLRVADSGTSG